MLEDRIRTVSLLFTDFCVLIVSFIFLVMEYSKCKNG